MGFSILQLTLAVRDGTMIPGMCGQCPVCPWLRTLKRIVLGIEPDQVHGQLSPGNDLVEKGFFVRLRCGRILYGESNRNRTDVTEMQIGRKPARMVDLRLVTLHSVTLQLLSHKTVQQPQAFARASFPIRDWRNR